MGCKMLNNEKIDMIRERLTVQCGSTTYTPAFFLKQGTVPMLEALYSIHEKGYKFTLPLFFFDSDKKKISEENVEDYIKEIKRNVELAHRRG